MCRERGDIFSVYGSQPHIYDGFPTSVTRHFTTFLGIHHEVKNLNPVFLDVALGQAVSSRLLTERIQVLGPGPGPSMWVLGVNKVALV